MQTQMPNIVTRAQASTRLIESAHQMFANNIDDLAILAVVGSVLTGAFEELDLQALDSPDAHPLKNFYDEDKDGFSRWFNFLKHGYRGPRSPGDAFDFSFLGTAPDRDVNLFMLIWSAACYHLSAYECSTPLIDLILLTGNIICGDDDEGNNAEDAVFSQNIRKIAGQWYSRHERARENNIDLLDAHECLKEMYAGPVAELLSSCPKREVRNRKSRRGQKAEQS